MRKFLKKSIAVAMALMLTAGVVSLSGTEYASAAEDTITVNLSFDCSSLGTTEALEEVGFDASMPDIEVKIENGETVYDAIVAANEKESSIVVYEPWKYMTSAYGLGDGLSGVAELLGFDPSALPSSPYNYSWAGWTFSVNGEMSSVGASAYQLNNDADIDFRYMIAYKDGGAYDWDFVDAYKATESAIKEAKAVNRSDYTDEQLEYLDELLSEAEDVKSEIDDESQGLWAVYYNDKGTLLYGPGSPTESLQTCSTNLKKAIDKEYYKITGVNISCSDVYVGEKTKIDVEVLPEGAPQDVTYELIEIGGKAEISDDGYIIGKQAGKVLVRATSKYDSNKMSSFQTIDIKAAPIYNISFVSEEASIDENDITVKNSSGEEQKLEDGKYKLATGKYTYEVNVSGKDKKTGTLIVNKDEFDPAKDNEINISWDTSAEEKAYKETAAYLNQNLAPNYEDWAFMGLARGIGITENQAAEYYKKAVTYVKSIENDRPYATDYARTIIALTSAGWDVTDVEGYNLLEKLSDMEYVTKQGLNGAAYTLIAYDTHKYEIPAAKDGATQTTRDGLVKYILSKQKSSGGWNWDENTDSADVDMTAMALQALAPYYEENEDVKKACDTAIQILSDNQETDGTYVSWGTKSASSIAEVIVALTALDIDPDNDVRFIKNGNSLIDGLNSLAAKNGGYIYDSDTANEFSTRSGYYAMAAYYRNLDGKTTLYDMSDVNIKENIKLEANNPITSVNPNNPVNSAMSNGGLGDGNVVTGDNFDIIIYIVIAAVALAIIMALTVKRKRYR